MQTRDWRTSSLARTRDADLYSMSEIASLGSGKEHGWSKQHMQLGNHRGTVEVAGKGGQSVDFGSTTKTRVTEQRSVTSTCSSRLAFLASPADSDSRLSTPPGRRIPDGRRTRHRTSAGARGAGGAKGTGDQGGPEWGLGPETKGLHGKIVRLI